METPQELPRAAPFELAAAHIERNGLRHNESHPSPSLCGWPFTPLCCGAAVAYYAFGHPSWMSWNEPRWIPYIKAFIDITGETFIAFNDLHHTDAALAAAQLRHVAFVLRQKELGYEP